MKSLWLKDRPWILTFAIVGAIALALAASDRGFVTLWVLAPFRLEVLYYVAGCVGVLLGSVAILWDDCLGTREFLKQRPLAPAALARSPIFACIAVLLSCMVSVPLLTWLLTAYDSGIYDLTFWAGLPELLSTLQIVWPACAIGCLAAAMPLPWWLRLLFAAALALTLAMGIDLGTTGGGASSDYGSMSGFALACLAPAAVLFWLAARLNAQRRDADQPWSTTTRLLAGSILVVSFGYSLLALVGDAEAHAVNSLHWEYPDVVEVDSTVRLTLRADRWGGKYSVANKNHVAVGEPRSPADFLKLTYRSSGIRELLDLDAPRFHAYGGTTRVRTFGRRFLIAHNGRAWLHDGEARTVRSTGIGAEHRAFPSGVQATSIDDIGKVPNRSATLVGDRATGDMWRYDPDLEYFVSWSLPNADRYHGVHRLDRPEWSGDTALTPSMLFEVFAREHSINHIKGASGAYVLKDGELLAIDLPESADVITRGGRRRTDGRTVTHGHDPMTFVVEVPEHEGVASFRHEFSPRTATELFYAGGAMSLSLVRPPLTQLLSSALAADDTTPDVWLDRLVCGGKRLWLLVAGFALAVGCALLVRRRLRRLGASPSACRFWLVTGLVAGPIASLLAVACESARNHARPAVVAPPLPRIVSVKKEIRS